MCVAGNIEPFVLQEIIMQVGTKSGNFFAFGGIASERINGRFTILIFISDVKVEMASGRHLFSLLLA